MQQESLKNKTIKGTIWSSIDNIVNMGVSFVIGIILARLLSPEDYGLLGIIMIFTNVCTTLINAGFTNSLIRKKSCSEEDYNTVFFSNVLMSLILWGGLSLCSSFIADFFNQQDLIMMIRVSCFSLVISSFSAVQQVRLTKRIDFKSQTKISLISSIASGVIGVFLAYLGYGVWSLIFQSLICQLIRSILLVFYNRWIPSLSFNKNSFVDLFGFGWKILVASLLDSLWKELYQLVVGKFYSPSTLGQYTRAKHYSQMFSSNLTTVIQRVTFPVLADIQDDKERMKLAYRRIIKMTMFITFGCMFFLAAISEPLIYSMIGNKWHDAAIYLPLICISSSLYPLHAINLNMLQVQGRSDLFLGLEFIKKAISIVPLLVGAFIGIIPMLLLSILTGVIAFFINSYYSGKMIGYSSWNQICDIAPSIFIAFCSSAIVYFIKYIPTISVIVLILQFLIGIVVFVTLCKITKIKEYIDLKNMLRPRIKAIKEKCNNKMSKD